MAIIKISHAIATCSWIDPATGLPETDTQVIVDPTTSLGFLTGNRGYRFCNFMSVWAELNTDTNRIQKSGFEAISDIYRGPSYAGIPSHAFMVQRDSFVEAKGLRFTQVVGAARSARRWWARGRVSSAGLSLAASPAVSCRSSARPSAPSLAAFWAFLQAKRWPTSSSAFHRSGPSCKSASATMATWRRSCCSTACSPA